MRSIRSASLSQEPETYVEPYPSYKPYPTYDLGKKASVDPYDDSYWGETKTVSIEPGQIDMKIYVEYDAVGDISDYTSPGYNPDAAEEKALDIANERLYALCQPKMLADYNKKSSIVEGIEEYEVTYTLTPR